LINEEVVGLAAVGDDSDDLDAVEEEDVNEDDDVDAAPESESLHFDPDKHRECIERLDRQILRNQSG
jgi:hypothetical protein